MIAAVEPRAWYRPSAADGVFLVATFVVFLSCRGRLLSDPGLGWHLRDVDAILAQGHWLTEDPFSGPRGGQPWLTNQWLGEIPFWLGWRWAGLEGIAVVAALIVAFTLRCLFRMLQHDGLPWPVATIWTVFAGLATSCSWVARPNLFTLLFILLAARACESFHAGSCSARRLLWLLPLFAVWANIHGGFMAGLVLLAASCGIESLLAVTDSSTRETAFRKGTTFGAILIGSVLATFINPYGPSLYGWLFRLLGDPYFMDLHIEWQSPKFNGKGAWQFEWLLLVFPLLMATTRRRPNAIALGHTLLLFHFALTSLRYVPLWVLVATPLLARSSAAVPLLEALASRIRAAGEEGLLFAKTAHRPSWVSSALITVGVLAGSRLLEGTVARIDPEIIPTAALDRLILLHAAHPSSQVFHAYDWGGYLTWHGWRPDGQGLQNWVDDRNEVQGKEHVEDYFSILQSQPGWLAKLDRAGVDFVCVQPGVPLVYRLAELPGWRETYRDQYAVIFVREPTSGKSPRVSSAP